MFDFKMTRSNVLLPIWTVYLALLLVCQTTRGYPHSPNAVTEISSGNSSQDMSISRLIETAYKNHELLQPQQWSQQRTERTQWDTSESLSEGTTQYRKRKLLQVSSTTVSMRTSSDEIVFPDGRISSMSPQRALLCRKNTFCENVADYPRQLVNAAIARNASLRFLESVDPMPSDIEQRIDVTDESTLCRVRELVIYPQAAQNKDKQWQFIVNQDDLKQGIRIELCLNDGQECSVINGFAEGYKTTCKQKYIYRELAAVGSNGNIVKEQFRFPSSCCCHVKFIGDPTVRLGLRLDLSANRTQYNRSNSAFSMSTKL